MEYSHFPLPPLEKSVEKRIPGGIRCAHADGPEGNLCNEERGRERERCGNELFERRQIIRNGGPSFFPTTSLLLSSSFFSTYFSLLFLYIFIFIPLPVSASKGRGEIPLDYSGKIRSSGKESLWGGVEPLSTSSNEWITGGLNKFLPSTFRYPLFQKKRHAGILFSVPSSPDFLFF